MISATQPRVIFVHGLFSSKSIWKPLCASLNQKTVEHHFFEYTSPRFRFSLARSIPSIEIVSRKLATNVIQLLAERESPLVFVTHSFGGVVVQRFLLDFEFQHPTLFNCIAAIVMFGPPNNGSAYLRSLRWLYRRFWFHPQEASLRPFGQEISDIQRRVTERFLYPDVTGFHSTIRFRVIVGESDGVVPVSSAISHFREVDVVAGDHSSMLSDVRSTSTAVSIVREMVNSARIALPYLRHAFTVRPIAAHERDFIEDLCSIQNAAFGPHERISAADLGRCLRSSGHSDRSYSSACIGLFENRRLVGFSLFSRDLKGVYVGYVCIDKQRTRSTAEWIYKYLHRISMQHDVPIFFEVRDPLHSGDARDYAKIRHFTRLGAVVIGDLAYAAPDMASFATCPAAFIPHRLLAFFPVAAPPFLPRERVLEAVQTMLSYFYFDWFDCAGQEERYDSAKRDAVAAICRSVTLQCRLLNRDAWEREINADATT